MNKLTCPYCREKIFWQRVYDTIWECPSCKRRIDTITASGGKRVKGIVASFEGLKGVGKTTTLELLGHLLEAADCKFVRIKDTGNIYTEDLSRIGIDTRDPDASQFLYMAQTITRNKQFIRLKNSGTVVLVDRGIDTLVAYGQLLSTMTETPSFYDTIYKSILNTWTIPDITFLLKCSESTRIERLGKRDGWEHARKDAENYSKLIAGYNLSLKRSSRRVVSISTERTPIESANKIYVALMDALKQANE